MALIQGNVASNKLEIDSSLAARVAVQPPYIGSAGGRYRLSLGSGLLTTVAAQTSTAGHIAAFRWGSTVSKCLVERIEVNGCMVTDFTTLQEFSLGLIMARSYSASHTGGTAATLTGDNCKLRTGYPTTALTDARIGTTGALTAGTHTLDAQPFLLVKTGQPAASTTTAKVPFRGLFDSAAQGGPIVLSANEGFILANMILMGAAGTAVVALDVIWRELVNADVPAATAL